MCIPLTTSVHFHLTLWDVERCLPGMDQTTATQPLMLETLYLSLTDVFNARPGLRLEFLHTASGLLLNLMGSTSTLVFLVSIHTAEMWLISFENANQCP